MSTQTKLQELLLPIILNDMVETLGDIKNEQGNTTEAIHKLTKAIEGVDLNLYMEDDIIDVPSIKRRVKRIEFLTGTNPHCRTIMRKFEEQLHDIVKTSYSDIANSDMYKRRCCNVTVWDLMTFFPQLRAEGVKIMKNLEKEYNIPNALYTIHQVKKIAALGRIFDVNIIKNMNEREFKSWISKRQMEFYEMYKCDYDRAERTLYEAVAKMSPEYMNERQLPFIEIVELNNIIKRIMVEEMKNRPSYRYKENHYPFVDRCPQQLNTVTDRFIEIILRGLIV